MTRSGGGAMPDDQTKSPGFLARFTVLRGAVRELWIIFGAKLLAILAYGVMNSALVFWLSSGYSTFSVADIKDFPALAARLKQSPPAEGVSPYLFGQLSATNRLRLSNYTPGADARLHAEVVGEINRLIRRGPLYEPQRFRGVNLSAETQSLLRTNLPAADLAHLNRRLLEDTYPNEISQPSSSGLGYGDIGAGNLIFIWSTLMTIFTVLVGSLVDAIGLRKALLLGFCVCVGSRGVMTFTTSIWLALPFGLFALALGEALMTPVMVAAIRRYSTTAQRSISFSIFYAMMNGGFYVASWIFDFVRQALGENGHFTVPILGAELGTYRTLLLVSLLLTLPNLLIVLLYLRDGVEAADAGVQISAPQPKYRGEAMLKALRLTVRDALLDTGRIFSGLWRQSAFYKFLVFLALVVAVRLIMYQMYYTYPKFGVRELGEGAPIMFWLRLNTLLIVILVPIIGALTQRISAYRMVTFGSFLSASSVFIMALPPQWFQPLADGWLGHVVGHQWLGVQGSVSPFYVMIFLYVVFLSVGEAFWSPRAYEYTAAIAPKGQEASYMSLSYLPYFLAKLVVGPLSGLLLTWYCPETGPRNSQMLWLIIALPTLIAPLGLLVLRRYVQVREAGREG
jgi:MFS family permease